MPSTFDRELVDVDLVSVALLILSTPVVVWVWYEAELASDDSILSNTAVWVDKWSAC